MTIPALGGNDSIHNVAENVTIDAGDDFVRNEKGWYASINLGTGNDSIANRYENVTLNGGKGNDIISLATDSSNNFIEYAAGDGNDTVWGFKTSDTLSITHGSYSTQISSSDVVVTLAGGAGHDSLSGGAGNDVITDYAAGDRISLGAAVTSASLNGSDAVLSFSGSRTLSVKNAKGKTLSLISSDGSALETIISNDVVAFTNSDAANITIKSAVKTADASARTKAVKIIGNSKDNSLLGGAAADTLSGGAGKDSLLGGAGNDTLTGGTGNDSLWDDAGKDTFIYSNGDGKDIIYGFDNTDILQITGTSTASYNITNKSVAFKVGSTVSAITIKDFMATTFNVNVSAYKISGSTLVKK